MAKILSFLSGGLDSVAMVHKLLFDTEYSDYEVHIHHVSLRNCENRWEAEDFATANCIEWFKYHSKKPFTYSENIFDFTFLKRVTPLDFHSLAFVTAQMILENRTYDFIAIGMNKTDFVRSGHFPKVPAIVRAIVPLDCKIPKKIYPIISKHKRELWQELPEDLRHLTWSCRTPIYLDDGRVQSCGQCHTCKDLPERGIYIQRLIKDV